MERNPNETTQLASDPNGAGRGLPMTQVLPLQPRASSLGRDDAQGSPVPPARWQREQPQDGRAHALGPEPWKLLAVPSILITPSSDVDSPPGSPVSQHLHRPRMTNLESQTQDRDLSMSSEPDAQAADPWGPHWTLPTKAGRNPGGIGGRVGLPTSRSAAGNR